MKVLIVDDARTNLKLLRHVLEAEKVEVVEALDGVQALDVLDHEQVDAVISDILMPRMDGYSLCYRVRKHQRLQFLPFIFYTATYTSPSDEKLCYDLGADKYLQKPAPVGTILMALEEVIRSSVRHMPIPGTLSESDITKEYSERLVAKLEAKNVELSEAKKKLEESNDLLEQAGAELLRAYDELEQRVRQRTFELQSANEQLEAFTHSVSHDLRTPLRHIANFSSLVLQDAAPRLDEKNKKYLQNIHSSAERVNGLIEAMLDLAHVARVQFSRQPVNLSELAEEVLAELRPSQAGQQVQVEIAPDMRDAGDPSLLRSVLMNLLGNAWKFTSKVAAARIEFGRMENETGATYFVRDNGAGFDMAYANKLFTAFQRLHTRDEFEGSGIGLATVKRIIERHGGEIWAEGVPNGGATFYFTLHETRQHENTDCR